VQLSTLLGCPPWKSPAHRQGPVTFNQVHAYSGVVESGCCSIAWGRARLGSRWPARSRFEWLAGFRPWGLPWWLCGGNFAGTVGAVLSAVHRWLDASTFAGTCPRDKATSRGYIQAVKSVKGAGLRIDARPQKLAAVLRWGARIAQLTNHHSPTPSRRSACLTLFFRFPSACACGPCWLFPVIAAPQACCPAGQLVNGNASSACRD